MPVNRALRKAYGIEICSVEELGARSEPVGNNGHSKKHPPQPANGNGFASPIGRRIRSALEHGAKEPGTSVLLAISREFGKSVDWLLTGEGKK